MRTESFVVPFFLWPALLVATISLTPLAHAQSGRGSPALTYIPGSSVKLYQVNGDCDWAEWDATITNKAPTCTPTASRAATNADVLGDDVPVAFEHNGELIVTFGDTIGAAGNSAWTSVQNSFQWHAHDPIARSTTANAADGLLLNFFLNGNHGLEVLPPAQPGGTPVDMGIDNVPHAGVSLNGTIYLGIKTGNVSSGTGSNDQSHDYSVLATFDETTSTFTSGRTISSLPDGHFVGPTFYLAPAGVLGTPPPVSPEPVMLIFGVGAFRASNVYLSIIPSTEFASGVDQNGNSATRYFSGISNGQPTWSSSESSAVPIVTDVDPANPTISNTSIFYSQPLGLWLMVYDGGRGSSSTEGLYFTYAPQPWGPWSTPQLVFNACRDKAFGNFMFYYYATAAENSCPSAMPAGVTSAPNFAGPAGPTIGAGNDPNTTRGTTYAPTFVERFTIISGSTLKLFYMFSTWNPYAVVMMESDFNIASGPASATLLPSPDGTTVYDTANNVSWLTDANLAASNKFGLPVCNGTVNTKTCVNASGSMSYQAAAAWVAGMNAANYLGHANWQLPTTPILDNGCGFIGPQNNSFGFNCLAGAMGSLYYTALGLVAPNTAVPIPNNTTGPFSNFQPYLYWSQTSTQTDIGFGTFSFNTGIQGSNTKPNFLYALPMIQGKISGTPAASGNGLQVNPGGQTVYDPVANVTWVANANLAATNAFGLPPCTAPGKPQICVNQDGAMNWDSATQLVTNMNAGTGYLGQKNWQLPPVDPNCATYYNCVNSPLGELFYGQLGLSAGMPVVATPDTAVGPFRHMQPYLYWSCEAATVQDACQSTGPASGFEWSFSFGNGFLGTDILQNEFYVTAYFVNKCTYSFSSSGQAFTASSGAGTIAISTQAGCPWSVGALPAGISLTSAGSGFGNGSVTFNVLPNGNGSQSSSFTIAGQTFTIAAPTTGALAHFTAGGIWTTGFFVLNKGSSAAQFSIAFRDDNGNPVALPFSTGSTGTLSGTVAAQGSAYYEASNPQASVIGGSAEITADPSIVVQALFRENSTGTYYEAAVPSSSGSKEFLLPFDATTFAATGQPFYTGVAIANLDETTANVVCTARDSSGNIIPDAIAVPALAPQGHWANYLFPALTNNRGTIDCVSNTNIAATALRFIGTKAFSSLPVIANPANFSSGPNPVLPHFASGGIWTTGFFVLNKGSSAAQFSIAFHDDNGSPIALPFSTGTANTLSGTVAAQGLAYYEASNPQISVIGGSGQITADPSIVVQALFRENSSGIYYEAAVPSSSGSKEFLLPFDATTFPANGLPFYTGFAIANLDATTSNVVCTARDSSGNIITGAIAVPALAPQGHWASYQFPKLTGKRGTIDCVSNTNIAATALRFIGTNAFSSLPVITK